jgi:hypothetical protein
MTNMDQKWPGVLPSFLVAPEAISELLELLQQLPRFQLLELDLSSDLQLLLEFSSSSLSLLFDLDPTSATSCSPHLGVDWVPMMIVQSNGLNLEN